MDLETPVQLDGWRREGNYIAARYSGEIFVRATVVIENPCDDDEWFGSADSNRDGRVDVQDWLALLAQWDPAAGPPPADPPGPRPSDPGEAE